MSATLPCHPRQRKRRRERQPERQWRWILESPGAQYLSLSGYDVSIRLSPRFVKLIILLAQKRDEDRRRGVRWAGFCTREQVAQRLSSNPTRSVETTTVSRYGCDLLRKIAREVERQSPGLEIPKLIDRQTGNGFRIHPDIEVELR